MHGAIALGDGHIVTILERAVEDAADAEAAQVVAVIQVGDQHLEHAFGIADGRGDVLHDGVEQGPEVGGGIFHRAPGDAGFRDGV